MKLLMFSLLSCCLVLLVFAALASAATALPNRVHQVVGVTLVSFPHHLQITAPAQQTAQLVNAEVSAVSEVSADAVAYRTRALEAMSNGQYENAKELLTVSLDLAPNDPIALYYLGVIEFNLGNPVEGRARFKQAHTALPAASRPDVVEIQIEGDYTFTPVSKDSWALQLKQETSDSGEAEPSEPPSVYQLEVDATYEMEVSKPQKEKRSKTLISIPIGFMLVWLFAR